MANEQQLIRQLAQKYGMDPQAVLAIASVEGGFHGSVGDGGTSFGPFQLHEGGALPHGIRNPAQWANSAAGIRYALAHMASVAHGLHGRQAVSAISSRFERPANVPAEIAKAMQRYGGVSGGGMRVASGGGARHGYGGGGSMSPIIQSILQNLMSGQQAQGSPLVPQIDPLAVRYGLNS